MADGRMLKKLISHSRRLASLKNDTHRLIYTWLIPHLDVEGRFHADPTIIKGSVVPRIKHITEKIIDDALQDMSLNELIFLYSDDGEQYLELRKFEDHQTHLRKERESPSKIPPRTDANQLQINSGVNPAQVKLREVKIREENTRHSSSCSELLFQKFWEAYPKKVNKKEALSRWIKAKLPDIEIILTAIENQKATDQWQRENGKYIPHPSTWINKERWNDNLNTEVEDTRYDFLKDIP
jgi:hypothetical protein